MKLLVGHCRCSGLGKKRRKRQSKRLANEGDDKHAKPQQLHYIKTVDGHSTRPARFNVALLLGGASTTSSTSSSTSTESTSRCSTSISINGGRGTTTRSAYRSFTSLLLGLHGNFDLTNFATDFNPDTAFATLMRAQGGNNSALSGIDALELKERASLATDDLELFDGAETGCKESL